MLTMTIVKGGLTEGRLARKEGTLSPMNDRRLGDCVCWGCLGCQTLSVGIVQVKDRQCQQCEEECRQQHRTAETETYGQTNSTGGDENTHRTNVIV